MANEAVKPQLESAALDWQRVRELLADALELPVEERAAFVERVSGLDSSLRARLDELIAAHDATSAAGLDGPAFFLESRDSDPTETAPSFIGRRIGAYRIEAEIAQGGMGAVFRAQRADDEFNKQVAIKLVRGAAFSSYAAELFRRERQVLASLEHPNIARLLDGGTTEDGSPFLVMEYVDGTPVTQYCEAHRLSIPEKLRLFQKICAAVHYAHQNLVIHRDIKPANVLVTEAGEPKLLDFGIAKIIAINAPGSTLTMGALTPAYASPEQLAGGVVTTATDTYGLGLVLYELLAGKRAFAADGSPMALQREILERDADPPSEAILAKMPTSAERANLEKLSRQLKGDLDSIVAKALSKDPLERYSSAAQFQEEITRYLAGQPVLAHAPTALYQARKFCRRHRTGVVTALLAAMLAAAGITMILRAERNAKAEQAIAEKRFNDVRRLANSLLFELHDSIWTIPGTTSARKLIVERAQEYLDSLAQDAKSDPTLLRELASAYERLGDVLGDATGASLGNSEQSIRNFRRAVQIRETLAAQNSANVDDQWRLAAIYLRLSQAFALKGQSEDKREFLKKAFALLEPLARANENNAQVRYELAKAYERNGLGQGNDPGEAIANFEKSLVLYEGISAVNPTNASYRSEVAFAHKHIGAFLSLQQQYSPALEHYRAALAIEEEQLRADPQNAQKRYAITFTYSDIGFILGHTGDISGALGYYKKAFDIRSALAMADPQDARSHQGLASTYGYIAWLLSLQGKFDQAIENRMQELRIRQALSQADPTNEYKQLEIMVTKAHVGETYEKQAFDRRTPAAKRVMLCRQAQDWLQPALPWLRKQPGKPGSLSQAELDEAEQAFARCQTGSAHSRQQ